MKRGPTGRYETTVVGGERVNAFVPFPLPPDPPLVFTPELQERLSRALLALGRLDAVGRFMPDVRLFLYSYVRKEAVLSSQIEGTQSSLSDLLLYELEEAPGVPMEDVLEVSSYVAAMSHGLGRLAVFPISNRLIREMHGVLMTRGRGTGKDAGEFRRSQNWIGGTRPGNAAYVPPPQHLVPDCMAALERLIHDTESYPVLVRAALAHVQFESIHPFLDGNGRLGRLLITLILCDMEVLVQPLLYLSLYFKQHRARYYELLDLVRREGDWEAWLDFFLEGVAATAEEASLTAMEAILVFGEDEVKIDKMGRRAESAHRVHAVLKKRPLTTIRELAVQTALSFPGVSSAVSMLLDLGVVREVTGKRRNRVFAYGRYLDLLARDTQTPFVALRVP